MLSALPIVLTFGVAAGPAQVKPAALKGYARILETRVKDGRVDYKGIAEHDLPKLDAFLAAVADAAPPKDHGQAIAFYVDAYNALVLRAVIAHGRPRSVLDVKDFFDAKTHTVAGQKGLSLNDLERNVLSPLAKDPRVHMVLVCGAVGCPMLESKPYEGSSDLSARLDGATRRYLASPAGLRAQENWLRISKIFDWYSPDFGGEPGALEFVRKYAPKATLDKAGPTPKVSYVDYNWTLNEQ